MFNQPGTTLAGQMILNAVDQIGHCDLIANKSGSAGGALFVDHGVKCVLEGSSFRCNCVGSSELLTHAAVALQPTGPAIAADATDYANSDIIEGMDSSKFANNCLYHKEGAIGSNKRFASVDNGSPEATLEVTETPVADRCFRMSEGPRKVGNVVLDSINAARWFGNPIQTLIKTTRTQVKDIERFQSDVTGFANWKYEWRPCKCLFELYGCAAHYLISRSGDVYRLVRDRDVAYHFAQGGAPANAPPCGSTRGRS
jgi:hypothetical protein